jgi:hypothetical protein
MALIIATHKDPFRENFKKKGKGKKVGGLSTARNFAHVRRPFRGIAIKEDTYATLEVYEADGTPVPLLNAGAREPLDMMQGLEPLKTDMELRKLATRFGPKTSNLSEAIRLGDAQQATYNLHSGDIAKATDAQQAYDKLVKKNNLVSGKGYSLRYSNFLLQQIVEDRQEKFQIMETFGVPFIFFFGQRPRVYQMSGILLNSLDFQWRAEFWANYDSTIRGTKLVERHARAVLSWDDIMVEGYILQARAVENTAQPYHVNLDFQFFVTNYQNLASIGDTQFPRPTSVAIDTTLWRQTKLSLENFKGDKYSAKTDAVRKANMAKAAAKQQKGVMGWVANTLAGAQKYADMGSKYLEGLSKKFETLMAGKDIRIPVGAFPLLSEIQTRPDLQKLMAGVNISGNNVDQISAQLAQVLSPETKRLILGSSSDPAGNPSFVVQDVGLLLDLTDRYNKYAFRRVKILPAGGRFVAPKYPEKAFRGRISDAKDEYVEQTLVPTSSTDKDWKALVNRERNEGVEYDKAEHLEEIVQQMVKKLRSFGASFKTRDMQAEMGKRALISGALTIAAVGGSFAVMAAIEASEESAQKKESARQEADPSSVADQVDVNAAAVQGTIEDKKGQTASSPKQSMDETQSSQSKIAKKVVGSSGVAIRPRVRKPDPSQTGVTGDKDADRKLLDLKKLNARTQGLGS